MSSWSDWNPNYIFAEGITETLQFITLTEGQKYKYEIQHIARGGSDSFISAVELKRPANATAHKAAKKPKSQIISIKQVDLQNQYGYV